MVSAVELIREIKRDMSPREVIERVSAFNQVEFNLSLIPTIIARRELLKKCGYIPTEWTFYSNWGLLAHQTPNGMLRTLKRNFPTGIEFLAIQGAYVGGMSGIGDGGPGGVSRYNFDSETYSVFIREKPAPKRLLRKRR